MSEKTFSDTVQLEVEFAVEFEVLTASATGITAVADTTGAGDAFAAGFLTFPEWRDRPAEACVHAHRAAQRILTGERR